ncbi:phosphatase PAP2 family protein [Sporomusa sp. KB1]|jgi:membrane-associated phospholipid phosphatase|uniref:phosphatase PAP2 family protein n=1 Tax=Sporomusa sp. KB1 TaxID=943346 RepID=UPI0011AD8AC6|nr:phosphatase PAP2 family protein [Sporomusa sp. KB1]TWH46499.1 Membrane-associated phospholipid phosphatase [Sporomusa sp. KB1]
MKKLVTLLVFLFLFGFSSMCAANDPPAKTSTTIPFATKTDQPGSERILPQKLLKDTGEVLTSPKHWDTANWNRFLLLGGFTYLTYKNDSHIQNWFQEKRSKNTNNIANVGNAFPVVGAAYLTGAYFLGNQQQRALAVNGLESMGIAVLSTEVIHLATNRKRPDGKKDSFPSSHTAAAFALATVIADEYGDDDKSVPFLAYGLATLTAYGRLNDNRHWGSDVVAGALIGHYTAKTVGKINGSRNVRVQPYIHSDQKGMVISKQF